MSLSGTGGSGGSEKPPSPKLMPRGADSHLTVKDLETVLILIDTVCASGLKRHDLKLLADLNDKVQRTIRSVAQKTE
jgi:hypothetical protein